MMMKTLAMRRWKKVSAPPPFPQFVESSEESGVAEGLCVDAVEEVEDIVLAACCEISRGR